MTTLTPDEVEVGRRNLIAVMKAAIRSDDLGATHGVVLNPDEASDLVALLEALKPVVVDREAIAEAIKSTASQRVHVGGASRLRQCELTEVESEAVHACQVATGNVVIEQETSPHPA